MKNPFWEAYVLSGLSQEKISLDAKLSRPTLAGVISVRDGIADSVKWQTMNRVAAVLGKRVVITLEPIEESGNVRPT